MFSVLNNLIFLFDCSLVFEVTTTFNGGSLALKRWQDLTELHHRPAFRQPPSGRDHLPPRPPVARPAAPRLGVARSTDRGQPPLGLPTNKATFTVPLHEPFLFMPGGRTCPG